MISRYSRKELVSIWSEENKYKIWLDVEIAAAEAMEKYKIIPKGVASLVKKKGKIKVKRIHDIEAKVKHDVIAFLTSITEQAGLKARYLHQGMTSSDVLDTTLNIQLVQSGNILLRDIDKILSVLKKQAKKYKLTPCIGRSHGIHAEPITFGLKLAMWSEELKRNITRWERAIDAISIGQISGAVGTYQHIDPDVEIEVCKRLNLTAATISNQVVQRDGHAEYLSTLSVIGATLEKISIEIRHLQRTEVLEAEEYFQKGQKGSSAMPHKRNPIVTERITGMARLLRGNAHVGTENVALWHERDISHSSVERIILPDSTTIMDYSLNKMINLIDNLLVYPNNMMKNINLTCGLIYSQEVLLFLIKKGLTREKAYHLVQKNAMRVWNERIDFKDLLLADKEISNLLKREDLDKLFDLEKIKINVDKIFKRIGLN